MSYLRTIREQFREQTTYIEHSVISRTYAHSFKQNYLCGVHLRDPSSLVTQALNFSANFSWLCTILILLRWRVSMHKYALLCKL
jgi:hypothetical protein